MCKVTPERSIGGVGILIDTFFEGKNLSKAPRQLFLQAQNRNAPGLNFVRHFKRPPNNALQEKSACLHALLEVIHFLEEELMMKS